LAGLGVAALTILATACGDATTSPTASAAPSTPRLSTVATTTTLTPAQGLLRTTPLAANVVVVKTLSSGGGGISIPGTDFQLQVPNGAFAGKSMTFTITAYAGNVVAYDFQPHGVVFLKPLKAVQQLGHTNWKSFNLPAGYYPAWSGAYFADSTQLNLSTGAALINEFMPGGVNVGGATMTWDIPHFSGYMIATGRMASPE
jgi:hypothetical protein